MLFFVKKINVDSQKDNHASYPETTDVINQDQGKAFHA